MFTLGAAIRKKKKKNNFSIIIKKTRITIKFLTSNRKDTRIQLQQLLLPSHVSWGWRWPHVCKNCSMRSYLRCCHQSSSASSFDSLTLTLTNSALLSSDEYKVRVYTLYLHVYNRWCTSNCSLLTAKIWALRTALMGQTKSWEWGCPRNSLPGVVMCHHDL